jgi:hypothetical protein
MSKTDSPGGISRHFRREAKLMAGVFFVLIVVTLLAGLFGPRLLRHIEIDRCLDAGGSFDHDAGTCQVSPSEK